MLELKHIDPSRIEDRAYQFADAAEIVGAMGKGKNVGLVYPTGTGKTFTAFLTVDQFLDSGKVLFLAHTNPLCNQHLRDARRLFSLGEEATNRLTGRESTKKRTTLWQKSRFVVATPQAIVNEIHAGRIVFEGISLVVFDEMHMARKKYAYVELAEMCRANDVRLLGLTASSGNADDIEIVEEHYHIRYWVYRSANDEAIRRFVFPKVEKPIVIESPRLHTAALKFLRRHILWIHNELAASGVVEAIPATDDFERRLPFYRLTELNALYPRLKKWVDAQKKKGGRSWDWYRYIALYGAYYRLMHLLNLFVTENYAVAEAYVKKISEELIDRNAEQPWLGPYYRLNPASLVWNSLYFQRFCRGLVYFREHGIKHPKVERLVSLIFTLLDQGDKVLVFSNYKESLDALAVELQSYKLDARVIAGNKFMVQREQQELLRAFREGEFSILLATTVIEAGIHVPKIDAVVNYSMPLTGIAQIQRGGRTGRTAVGEIYYLIADNSNDSSLYYAARSDNVAMHAEMLKRQNLQAREAQGEDVAWFWAKQAELPLVDEAGKSHHCERLEAAPRRTHGRRLPSPKSDQLRLFVEGGEDERKNIPILRPT